MAWIESHQEIQRHTKTKRLRRSLGLGLPATIGHLHMFWWWALSFAEDGDLSAIEDETIAEESGWEGDASEFVASLIAAGFINEDRLIHDWDQYTGRIRKQRQGNRERQQRWRENNAPTPSKNRDKPLDNALLTRDRPLYNPATGPDRTNTGPDLSPPVVPPAAAEGDGGADAPTTAPPVETQAKRKPRGTPVPASFPLTDKHLAYAAKLGLDSKATEEQTAKFLAHHKFRGTIGVDWYAGWQNWLRDSVGRFAPRGSPANGRASPPALADHLTSTVHRTESARF